MILINFKKLLLIIPLIGFAACTQQTAEVVEEEIVVEEDTAQMPIENQIEIPESATSYAVDPNASSLTWMTQKRVGAKHVGTVEVDGGEIIVDGSELLLGDVIIDMSTIKNEDLEGAMKEQLEGHLNSEDFFDTANYPEAQLQLLSAVPTEDDEGNTHIITADLTIKGITNQISFPASISIDEDGIVASAVFTIDRAQWDIRFGSESFFENLGDGLIEDEIEFTVELFANAN